MIKRYRFKPEPHFYLNSDESMAIPYRAHPDGEATWSTDDKLLEMCAYKTPFYGIELEAESRLLPINSCFWKAISFLNDLGFYVKTDSSLINGLEFVSHPRTFKSWMSKYPEVRNLFEVLKKKGVSGVSTRCGLHIHLGFEAFMSVSHFAKFAKIMQELQPLILAKENRTTNAIYEYCIPVQNWKNIVWEFMSKRGLEKNSELFFSTNRNTHENPDVQHHSAISITNNTIEIRMFSGTSSALKLMRSIGLLESIRQYTAQYGFAHATKDSYLEWLSHRHEKIFKIVYAKLSLKCFSQRTYDSVQQFIAQNLEEKKANDDVNKTLLNLPEVVLDDTKNNAITRLLNPFPLEMINFPSAMFMFARRIFGSSIGIQRKVKLDRTSNSFLFACMEQLSFESTEKYTTKLMEMAYTYLTNEAQKAIATKYLALNQNDRTLVSEFARMVLKTMALGATGVNSRSTVEQVYEKLKKLPNVPFSGTEETIELEKLGVSVALEFGFIEIKDDPNPKEAIALIIGALYSGPIDTWEEITTTCKKLENVYSLRRNIITNLIQKYANRFPDIEKKLQPICMVTEQIVLYLNEILTTKTPIVKFKFHASTLLTHACWCTYGYEMFTVRYERKSEIDLLREFSPEIFGGRARESMWTIPSMKVKTKKKIPKKYTILGWPTTITDKYLSLCATSTPDNALRRMFLPPDGQFRERPDPEGREDRDDDYGRQQGVVTHFDDLEQVDSGEALDRIFEIRNGTAPGVAI